MEVATFIIFRINIRYTYINKSPRMMLSFHQDDILQEVQTPGHKICILIQN